MKANLLFNSQVGYEWGVFLTFKARVVFPLLGIIWRGRSRISITSDEQTRSERKVKQQKIWIFVVIMRILSIQAQKVLKGSL